MFEAIAFYLFAALTAAMFLIVVTTHNILHALSALAAGMIFISAFFFLLGAEFLGVAQIIVYTGAVIALYAFGMMFFDSIKEVKEREESRARAWILVGILALLLLPILAFFSISCDPEIATQSPIIKGVGNTQTLGYMLFTQYLIPFELAAVMLLVAMIAGIVLAGKKMDRSLTLMSDEDAEVLLKKSKKRSF